MASIDTHNGLIARAKAILLTPKEEWPRIAEEQTSIGALYLTYAVILAAIPAVAQFLRSVLFGYGAFGLSYRPGFVASLGAGIGQYILSLISVAILALVTDFIVTKFDGQSNRMAAFKLAIYGSTAVWLSGIFQLFPGLSLLAIVGLYSLYLVYLGLTPLMQVPREKALACTAVILLAALVVSLVAAAIVTPVSLLMSGSTERAERETGGTLNLPGVGSLDLGKLEQAGKDIEAAAARANDNPIEAAQLKAFFPEALGAYKRTKLSSASMGAGGMGGSQVSASYALGDKRLELDLVDLAAAGALAGIGSALNIETDEQTADGFERTYSVDGQMVSETWNGASRRGSYSRSFAGRFALTVAGDADDFESLKAIADNIDTAAIARLAQ